VSNSGHTKQKQMWFTQKSSVYLYDKASILSTTQLISMVVWPRKAWFPLRR